MDNYNQYLKDADKRHREHGKQGFCDTCGRWSGALIEAMCKPCREKYL